MGRKGEGRIRECGAGQRVRGWLGCWEMVRQGIGIGVWECCWLCNVGFDWLALLLGPGDVFAEGTGLDMRHRGNHSEA